MATVRRIEDVAQACLRPRRHTGLPHTVDHLEPDGVDHHAVEDDGHAVVVGILGRVPPRRPEGHRVDLGANQPAIDLRQIAVLQDPVDILVIHRTKLEAFGDEARHARMIAELSSELRSSAIRGCAA